MLATAAVLIALDLALLAYLWVRRVRRHRRIRERLEWYTLHGWAEKNARAMAAREGTVNCERG